jgi:hypothetical protein
MGTNRITFLKTSDSVSDVYAPTPAATNIPEWYKKQESYIDGIKTLPDVGQGRTKATVKKCMPVFDAITQGYLIYSFGDVEVTQRLDTDGPYFRWTTDFDAILFHPASQASSYLPKDSPPIPKWNNPWAIKTPKGYSSFITSPVYRNNIFETMEGVVDTDTYNLPILFLFKLKDPNFTGVIPAGTPIAQIFPFKREKWNMEIAKNKDLLSSQQTLMDSKFYDRYKSMFRQEKKYT